MDPRERLRLLLLRANPTEFQRELIARLQRQLGVPQEPGPNYVRQLARRAEQRARREQERRQREEERFIPPLPPLPPLPRGPFIYRRIVDLLDANQSQRRIHPILVYSSLPIDGERLERAFLEAVQNLRQILRYRGPIVYISPEQAGRDGYPIGYVPFNPLEFYEFDVPLTIPDESVRGITG